MENFSLNISTTAWTRLKTILDADTTFSDIYLWSQLKIRDTHASNTIIVKTLPGTTAPASNSGSTLGAGEGESWGGYDGTVIDGAAIWLKASGTDTTFDISFIRKAK